MGIEAMHVFTLTFFPVSFTLPSSRKFVFEQCTPGSVICGSGLGLCILEAEGSGVLAHGNVRACSGLLYWEVWFDRLAPLPARCANAAPRAFAWVGVVQDPTQPLSSADATDGLCLFSGGTLLRQNEEVSELVGTKLAGFREGDAVGMLLDCENRELSFWINGQYLGVAFCNVPLPLTPAVQIASGQVCQLRLGRPCCPSRTKVQDAMAILARKSQALSRQLELQRESFKSCSGSTDQDWQGHELVW